MSDKIAIVGTGIAGMACAHFLYRDFEITMFEKNSYVGGHTNTVMVDEGSKQIPVDTGFMVCNPGNYPNLFRLFSELNVPLKKTAMSFSVQHVPSRLEYTGSGLSGLFAQPGNLFNLRYVGMLLQIDRFNRICVEDMANEEFQAMSISEYVEARGFGTEMLYKYLLPMTSALWSTPTDISMKFPALALVNFFRNHGFLGLNTQHQWYTVDGGSQVYRDRLIAPFRERINVGVQAKSISRSNGKVQICTDADELHEFDKVIFACHADQVVEIFQNPYKSELDVLNAFKYQENIITLHSDATVMPRNNKVWSSWNYRIEEFNGSLTPSCIYYMNKLQQVSNSEHYFVSINDPGNIEMEKVHREISYQHPIFTVEAMHAQRHLPSLNEEGPVYYCGSYFRYGFHEDAFTSAVDVCQKLLGADHPVIAGYATLFDSAKLSKVW